VSEVQEIVRLLGTTRADTLEIGEYIGRENVSFEDQPIMERSSGEIALGAAAILASAVALKGLIAYLVARYRPEEHVRLIFERERNGERDRLVIETDSIKGGLEAGLAEQLGSFSGIPVREILGA
jgi:hypothetical protein